MEIQFLKPERENLSIATHEPAQYKEWLNSVLLELNHIDQEVAEESLPEIFPGTKDHARRILFALATQSIAPTVYPLKTARSPFISSHPLQRLLC